MLVATGTIAALLPIQRLSVLATVVRWERPQICAHWHVNAVRYQAVLEQRSNTERWWAFKAVLHQLPSLGRYVYASPIASSHFGCYWSRRATTEWVQY